ncbi:aldo/keto reductase [Plantactinospora sp. KLBMP9567]|uniref:aldo/keto reductase n=1 Tax=Plantactinospora sp. KLBMP9567 TaxID=3085900 RepID=UPI00298185B6|nr:aldo/keto reductase [Plantactinospora sp. KLBMP9567]MDW5326164.1 aldo/keto reductase [Plantactinospora sp. KLBMP9567]
MKRPLGRSGIEISALGAGCWAIGGPYGDTENQYGWGGSRDDDESIRALHRARDLGITFFDTASSYGAGHSETLIGSAFHGVRDQVVIATKWGYTFDEERRLAIGDDDSLEYIRTCLEGSLRRLRTDYVDLYQLHLGDLPVPRALEMIAVLDDLVIEGKIRSYGWSTDDAVRAAAFAEAGAGCTAIQHDLSVLSGSAEVLAVCEKFNQASINRGPLAMGLLSGKYHDGRQVPGDDVRSQALPWMRYFRDGAGAPEWLAAIDAIREVLTSGGRTLAQGALAWLWARSPATVPIPGFRTVEQVEENAAAMSFGPLTAADMAQIDKITTTVTAAG